MIRNNFQAKIVGVANRRSWYSKNREKKAKRPRGFREAFVFLLAKLYPHQGANTMQTTSSRAGRTPADDTRCRHLTLGGARCTSPTLYGKDLCYQHGHRDKVLRVKPAVTDNFPLAPIVTFDYMEDHLSVLANINAIADAFSRHAIDFRQVTALTYLMQTALKTLKQMSEIETKITAEEVVREVVYDDLDQPLAVPDPEPAPEPELATEPDPELPPAPELQPEAEFQPIPASEPVAARPASCHPEEHRDEGSAVVLPPITVTEPADCAPATPQPTQIQTLKASAEPNPIVSHTYEISKKQPSSFHTHAEIRGRG